MHAGGVLIAPGKLTDFCPLYVQPGAEATVSQFDKDDVEAVGPRQVRLPRADDADDPRLDAALRAQARSRHRRSTLETLAARRQARLRHLPQGNTTAVFQFESRGMRDLLKQAPPTRFEDIIALVALYRPGPMELIPDYVDAQARPRSASSTSTRAWQPILEPDVRRDGVPGAGDADRAGDRRLHARQRRPAAPRDGQEEARGDGDAPRRLRRRRARRTASREHAPSSSST